MLLVLLSGLFLPSENTQTDRQTITKRHYDRKYLHIHALMLLNTYEKFGGMHNIFDAETQLGLRLLCSKFYLLSFPEFPKNFTHYSF